MSLFNEQPGPGMVLRNYQESAKRELYSYLREKTGNPCIVIPTGGGKSPLMASICADAVQLWNGRVLIAAHVKELLTQTADKLQRMCPTVKVGIYSAGLKRRDTTQEVIVGGVQSIFDKSDQLGRFDLLLIDECFTADTMISTPMGDKRIDNMRCGDTVYCASGIGVVERSYCRPSHELYRLEFSDGTKFTCTGNHPIFTDSGWTKARAMELGSFAYGIEAVRFLWENIHSLEGWNKERNTKRTTGEELEQSAMLLSILCKEIQEPDEQSPVSTKNESTPKRNKAQAYQAWRERAIAALGSISLASRVRRGLGIGSSDQDRAQSMGRIGIPNLLQNRHSESCDKGGDRTGRKQPHDYGKKATGCKEDGLLGRVRLVNISHSKSESPRTVYNLHVSGHPSYFANGKLVHNCHLIPESGYGRYRTLIEGLIEINPDIRVCGLTATPFRTDTGRICTPDGILNHVCYEISVKELIARGYLTKLVSKAANNEVDVSEIKVVRGEYDEHEAELAFIPEDVVEKAVDEILLRTKDRKSVLIFCQSIAHAEAVASRIRWAGHRCHEVYGDTKAEYRKQYLGEFQRQEIQYLVNVNVLTTGFDAPAIDCVCLMRATVSPGLFYQMVGRGFRLADGKLDCLILDFGTNIERHGPVDMIEPKVKGESDEEPKGKKCPDCSEVVGTATMICPACGYEWPKPEPKHGGKASKKDVVSGEAEISERSVLKTTYKVHEKKGAPEGHPRTLRVTYQLDGPEWVSEWICVEHPPGFARRKAEAWWASRSQSECPTSAEDAFDYGATKCLSEPYSITIKIKPGEKFPEITKYKFREPGEDDLSDEYDGPTILEEDQIPF